MKVNVLIPSEIDIKPGDKVKLYDVCPCWGAWRAEVITTVKRVVESRHLIYAVFDGGYAYRPFSTYGKTWEKVEV
jgi:hypothetical protein